MCMGRTNKQRLWVLPHQPVHLWRCISLQPPWPTYKWRTFHTWSPTFPTATCSRKLIQITCSISHSPESQCTLLNTKATLAQLWKSTAVSNKQGPGLILWDKMVSGPLCNAARPQPAAMQLLSLGSRVLCTFDAQLSKLIILQRTETMPWTKRATASRCYKVKERG